VRANDVWVNLPATRHAEVKNQRIAPIRLNQAIFGAPPKARHLGTLQPLPQIKGNGPTQIGAARFYARQPLSLQHSGKPTDGCFNFRKLRHVIPLAGGARLG